MGGRGKSKREVGGYVLILLLVDTFTIKIKMQYISISHVKKKLVTLVCCSWDLHCHWPVLQKGSICFPPGRSCVPVGDRGAARSLALLPSVVSIPIGWPERKQHFYFFKQLITKGMLQFCLQYFDMHFSVASLK